MHINKDTMRLVAKWRGVHAVAREFSGWYNVNDVRRFVAFMAQEYQLTDGLTDGAPAWALQQDISEDEAILYSAVIVWLNLRIMREQFDDALGALYMTVGYPNRDAGQFFTPYEISLAMAMMQMPESRQAALAFLQETGEDKISIYDPACGSGGMLCAAWEVAYRAGYDDLVEFYGQDIDPFCVLMTRLNLTMRLEVPAIAHAAKLTHLEMALQAAIGMVASPPQNAVQLRLPMSAKGQK